MRLRLAITVAVFLAGTQVVQAQPRTTPADYYQSARNRISEGKYDLALEDLKQFLANSPTDADFLKLQERYGSSAFLQLRNVLRWSDNEKVEKEAQETVEKIIAGSIAADTAVNRNPDRIRKFIKNLIANVKEERIYAQRQLFKAGDAVVPFMVDELRTTLNPGHQHEILALIPSLNDTTVPGFLASVEGLPPAIQPKMLLTLANRTDVLNLVSRAETNFVPHLWYFAGNPDDSTLKQTAIELLTALTGGVNTRTTPEVELTRLARPFAEGQGEFRTLDMTSNKVTLALWDASKLAVVTRQVTVAEAREYFGLRNLRWAIERKPNYLPAQELFLKLATERAVERAKFSDLTVAEPNVYRLLASTPTEQLLELLQTSLQQKRTAQVLGFLQAISDRVHQEPAIVGTVPGKSPRPSAVVQALNYPDPRVQFAAAVAILRSPTPASLGNTTTIVDILRSALGGETTGGNSPKGRVLITDPNAARGNKLAQAFQSLGFDAERLPTGRDLMLRIRQASDYDAIVLDRHTVAPQLPDLLAQISADRHASGRPTLVIASSDRRPTLTLDELLLRAAMLVTATETLETPIPPPPEKPNEPIKIEVLGKNGEIQRLSVIDYRDGRFASLHEERLDRLTRLITAADLPLDEKQQTKLQLRLIQFVYAGIIAEFGILPSSAPQTYKRFEAATEVIVKRTELVNALERVPVTEFDNLIRLIDQLEARMTDEQKQQFENLRLKVARYSLGITMPVLQDPEVERPLIKLARPYKFVSVIPETLNPATLATELQNATQDSSQLPRDPAERAATARQAVMWLRKLATGEIAGYSVTPAAPELLAALKVEALAPDAVEAVAKLGTAPAQRELVNVVLSSARPKPLRLAAADAALRNVRAFGNMVPEPLAGAIDEVSRIEKDQELRASLTLLATQLVKSPPPLSQTIQQYPILPPAPAPKPMPPVPMNERQ